MTVSELWEEYMNTRSIETRNQLVEKYLNFVGYLVGRIINQLPPGMERDDLIQFGVCGLIGAVEKYNPAMGAKFETYASRRIKGAIIDEIRHHGKSNGGLTRTMVAKQKAIEEAINVLEQQMGRQPKALEIADYLGYTMEEYNKVLGTIGARNHMSLDRMVGYDDSMSVMEVIQDEESPVPEQNFLQQEFKTILGETINELPEKEKIVIILYYYENWTLKEIGKYLNLSEPRISQLHTQSMMRMRAKLTREE